METLFCCSGFININRNKRGIYTFREVKSLTFWMIDCFFFFNLFERHRGRERETDRWQTTTSSIPWFIPQCLAQPRARSSIQVSYMGSRNSDTWNITCCFPRWPGNGGGASTQIHTLLYGMWTCQEASARPNTHSCIFISYNHSTISDSISLIYTSFLSCYIISMLIHNLLKYLSSILYFN